jgi:glycosyltransferase involved in cell wall biosynthesis
MRFLNVLVLPVYPPSVTYRAWADGDAASAMFRRLLERIVRRFGNEPFIIACPDEEDRQQAERIAQDLGGFFAYCPGLSPLVPLGGIARAFPGFHLVCFQIEQVFSPADLLDRLRVHHEMSGGDYTYTADLPPELGAEIIDGGLLAALAAVEFDEDVPTIRDAMLNLSRLREAGASGRPVRVQPFEAGSYYRLPPLDEPPRITARDDAYRAVQSLRDVPEDSGFQAVENWNSCVFEPDAPSILPQAGTGRRMRVLYMTPAALYSGAEESLRHLVQGVGRLGFEQAAVVGAEGTLSRRLREAGCQVIAANWDIKAPGRNSERLAAQVFDAFSPHVVHFNSDPGPAFPQAAVARGVPMIIHARTTFPAVLSSLFRDSACIVAVSGFVKQRLICAGAPEEKIQVIYNGIDPDAFRPGVFDRTAMRLHFGLPPEAFLILMVARVDPNKRHDLLIDALSRLLPEAPHCHLVFVGEWGDFRYLREVKKQIRAAGVESNVTWLPFQDDIRKIEAAADVLVLCSDEESAGRCVLEAMSMQIPVVVGDSGGNHELMENGLSGIVVPGGKPAPLAAALHRVASDDQLRRSLGQRGRERVLERYTQSCYAAQVARRFELCAGFHLLE